MKNKEEKVEFNSFPTRFVPKGRKELEKMSKKIIIIITIISVIIVLTIASILGYNNGLKPVNKDNNKAEIVEIEQGTRTEGIINLLKEKKLIRSSLATKIYIKLNKVKNLQAGKYELNQSMPLSEILKKISSGEIYDESVKITFKEGKNMRWIAKTIAEKTNNTEEDVFNLLKDETYIDSLIQKYWFLSDTIKDQNIYYALEGYLYPDTYKFENANVSVKTIFNIILNNTDKVLSDYKQEIENKKISVHNLLTIASIIELEGKDSDSRAGISSVIYNRLKSNMSLGSDVTTYYAMQVDMGERNLYSSELKTSNPYNTRGPNMNGKLPIGPIANPSEESIKAALNPSQTNYLYFVADSNGKIYFAKTYQEHQNIIKELQKQGLWYEYSE